MDFNGLFQTLLTTIKKIITRLPLVSRHSSIYNLIMKPDLLEILVCPLCKKRLVLTAPETKGHEIITGFLYCDNCKNKYPVSGGIPGLLPPETNP
jgi:uncharacterized protein YbaR (Trm112 family)